MGFPWLGMVLWDGKELVPSGFWLRVSQPNPFIYTSPVENLATLNEKGKVDL